MQLKAIIAVIFLTCVLSSCDSRKPAHSLQELNFEVFWQQFEDNYAFFDLKGMDWMNTYEQYRDQVDASTSDDELFEILSSMVAPLEDGHVHIEGNEDNYFNQGRPSQFRTEFDSDSLVTEFWGMVHNTLISEGFGPVDSLGFEIDNEKLFHFSVSDEYGYLRFLRSDPTGEPYTANDLIQIREDLNVIFEKFQDLNGLIVDVRLHRGGFGSFSYEVAGRFTEERVLGHYTQSRISGSNPVAFDSLTAYYIEPDQVYATHKFLNKVVLLTNDQVGSAGELFVMAMKQLPTVTTVGSNTTGIMSTMYEFNLPNGWWVSLSNERTYSPDMNLYEGTGIPVDIEVFNTREGFKDMTDPALIEALAELERQ